MSPHAISVADDASSPESNSINSRYSDDIPSLINSQKSLLYRSDDSEIHDLVGIGFGPASLAIAVALHDAIETDPSSLNVQSPKIRFLERQEHFAWHAGMLLPGAKMQITFVKDMATLRNPRSRFTFLNYLHHKGRLSAFTNLGTFLPRRIEYEDYMRWCAEQFGDVVDYSQNVDTVNAGRKNPKTGAVETFVVTSTNPETGRKTTLETRHVVIAAGGKPSIPSNIPSNHPRILHSSQYFTNVDQLFPSDKPAPKCIAVIGAGQSAAEIFNNIPSHFPGTKSVLLIRKAALKPSDDSPFVNEVFDPERVDDIFYQPPYVRAEGIASDKSTNYGVVRLELLEEIYSEMYAFKLEHDSEDSWPKRILPHRSVISVRDIELDEDHSSSNNDSRQPGVELLLHNDTATYRNSQSPERELLRVDAVIVASGYVRDAHEDMLKGLRRLMPGGDGEGKRWTVNRQYGVEFEDGKVKSNAGVWLQGCNEGTHGLSDTLLSILAVRGGEMVQTIFGATPAQEA